MESKLHKQVFNKKDFNKTIKTDFNQLVQPSSSFVFDINQATIGDFFSLYNKFFYEIPKLGDVNSHEFLYKTSKEYVGFEVIDEQIQALLDEISSLREENLSLNEEIINSLSGNDSSGKVKPLKINRARV